MVIDRRFHEDYRKLKTRKQYMNIDITSLIRDNVRRMKKYASARDEFSGKAKVFLDANENSFGSPADKKLNRYPDPLQKQLRDKISAYKGLSSPQRLFLGNGSDEAIDLILRAFCEPKSDSLMLLPPTYGMYSVAANVNDVKIIEVPLKPDFSLDVSNIIDVAEKEKPKVIFICSPNNPSANVYDAKDVEKLLEQVESLVIVDEAYIHFADSPSWVERLDEFKNLIVLQTFSKAWGLAGARLGMAFADPQIIEVLNKIKYPYNISDCAAGTVMNALEDIDRKENMVSRIKAERSYLMNRFGEIKIVKEVLPSQANFFLARFDDPDAVYSFLTEEGIVVRNRSNQLHCEGCLRITIGTREQNDLLCDVLNKYSEKVSS